MAALSPALVLDLWERAEPLDPVGRALALAAAVDPPVTPDEVAALPLGRRDARLLRLRAGLAGPTLDATAVCPECGEQLEFAADCGMLLAEQGATVSPVRSQGVTVTWRPPDSRDVRAASACPDAAAAERVLLERCVEEALGPDGHLPPHRLPTAVRAAMLAEMARVDPLAEVLIELVCPVCEAGFVADLDVAGFVWAEVRARATRLLGEVDALARAYGWTEPEVLALGEQRRAAYLRLLDRGP